MEGTRTIYECPFTSEGHQELTHVQSVLLSQHQVPDMTCHQSARSDSYGSMMQNLMDLQSTCMIGKPINA
jgi:hypothetical protein